MHMFVCTYIKIYIYVSLLETTYKVEVHRIVVEKVLRCPAQFSCPERCTFGFRKGTGGCPSCTCLQPVIGVISLLYDV